MKHFILTLFLCSFATVAFSQVPVERPTEPPPLLGESVLVVSNDAYANSDVSSQHTKTLALVKTAIRDSGSLRPLQKRRLLRRLNRPAVAVRVTDVVTSAGISLGAIDAVMVPSSDGFSGDVEILIDWDAIIGIIEKLIPLIITIIGMFG